MNYQQLRTRADLVRGLPLQSVLLAAGAQPDRFDKAKWHTGQGVVSVTGAKFKNWTRGSGGGGAIDLAIHLNLMGFKDAVLWLWQRFPDLGGPAQAPPAPRPGLRLPVPQANQLWHIRQYLVRDRALNPALIEDLILAGELYADQTANAVFLLRGDGQRPVGAELRGTRPQSWHGLAPGSRKDLGYFSVHGTNNEGTILCESAIDAISCFMLHPRHHCLSTAGARPNPLWLAPLLRQAWPLYCGFDADQTGDDMARAMIALHPGVQRLRPSHHDWNDVLMSAR